MGKRAIFGLAFFCNLVLAAVVFSLPAQAASLNLTFYEGGNDIDFGRVDTSSLISRELRIEVTNTGGIPYQLRQIIAHPISNSRGATLKDEVLAFYTIRGSNARGTLYNTIKEPLYFRDEVLYISDGQGSADSFKLVYLFDGKKLTTPGKCFGKMGFVIEPKQGAAITRTFDIEFDAQVEFDVQFKPSRRPLVLSSKSEESSSAYIDFQVASGIGTRLNVYQRAETIFVNEQGEPLPQEAIRFFVSGKGEYKIPTEISPRELMIYGSDNGGQDSFRVSFIIEREKLKQVQQGNYKGRLIYRIYTQGKERFYPIDLEIKAERVFDMKITSEGLHFRNLKPSSLPEERVVLIDVDSNLQAPYQIDQILNRPLTSPEGRTIAAKYFSMRQQLLQGRGEVVFSQFTPVEMGEQTIFVSDSRGGDVSLQLIYRLTPVIDIYAGNYSTTVTYSLSER